MRMLQTYVPAIFLVILMRFRLPTLLRDVSVFARKRAFLSQCVFDENAQRISMDRRVKRIEIYAFSNENTSV